MQDMITNEPERYPDIHKYYLQYYRAFVNAIPILRAHPEIEKQPPLMSMDYLRWHYMSDPEVHLRYDVDREKYHISIWREKDPRIVKEIYVELDALADAIWSSINEAETMNPSTKREGAA